MGWPNLPGIFPDGAGIVVRAARCPRGLSGGQVGVRDDHVDGAFVRIDNDLVTIAQQCDRSAGGGLRPDMADAEAARGAKDLSQPANPTSASYEWLRIVSAMLSAIRSRDTS